MKRKIDDLGRLVINKEFRKELGIENGDEVNIELKDNKIIITNPETKDKMQDLIKYLEDKIKEIQDLKIEDLETSLGSKFVIGLYKEILDKVRGNNE